MTNTPSSGCWPNNSGALPAEAWWATCNHRASKRLRSTGACQSAATRNLDKARLAQTNPFSVSMHQISDDTPPVRGLPYKEEAFERPRSFRARTNSVGTSALDMSGISGFNQFDQCEQGLVNGGRHPKRLATSHNEAIQMVNFTGFRARHVLCSG